MVDQLRHLRVSLDEALTEFDRVRGREPQAVDAVDASHVFDEQSEVGDFSAVV